MAFKSKTGKIIGAVLLVIILLLTGIILYLDSLIADAIRTIGSSLLGTKVEVASVSLSIFSGNFSIQGFIIYNPPGFHAEQMLSVDDFSITLDVGTLLEPTIVIEQVEISGMHLNYEPSIKGGSNVNVILNQLNGKAKEQSPKKPESTPENSASEKQVIIRHLEFRDTKLSVSSSALRSTIPLQLPPIRMENVGEKQTLPQTVQTIFLRLLTEIGKVFSFEKFPEQLAKGGNQLLEHLDNAAGTVGGAVVSAGESAGGALDDALKQSKNLLRVIPGAGQ